MCVHARMYTYLGVYARVCACVCLACACFEGACVEYVGVRQTSLSAFCGGCASELSLYYSTFYSSDVFIRAQYASLPGYCVLGFDVLGESDGLDIETYYSRTRNNLIRIDDGFALCIIKAQARL